MPLNTNAISNLIGESGGCEPEFAMKYTRRTVGMTDGENTYFTVFCRGAREYMDVNKTEILPSYFVSAPEIPWPDRIATQAVMQKHVDTAISSTVNLPNEATKEDIAKLYLMAWREGLKGVTIYRSGCKREPILSTKKKDNHNEKIEEQSQREYKTISELPRGCVLETSNDLIGKKRKLQTGCGSLHCTAFFDPETGELMETYLSRGSTGGCANSYTGLSRMISLAARAGVGIDAIIDQLNSCGVCPSYAVRRATKHDTSPGACCPIAIGKALKEMWTEMQEEVNQDASEVEPETKPIKNLKIKTLTSITVKDKDTDKLVLDLTPTDTCPECGEPIIHTNGCVQCPNCSWSKCS